MSACLLQLVHSNWWKRFTDLLFRWELFISPRKKESLKSTRPNNPKNTVYNWINDFFVIKKVCKNGGKPNMYILLTVQNRILNLPVIAYSVTEKKTLKSFCISKNSHSV